MEGGGRRMCGGGGCVGGCELSGVCVNKSVCVCVCVSVCLCVCVCV